MQSILDFISHIDPINLITALATVFAAIAAFFSARAAYHSVNAQILAAQIALYDRMLSVFNGVNRFIESVVVGDDSTSEEGEKFRREARYMFQKSISESRFIFDELIQDYIHEISSKEVKLRQAIRRSNKHSSNNEEREKYEQERNELFEWFAEQQLRVIEKFNPYLNINLPISLERKIMFHQYQISLGTQKSFFKRLIALFRRKSDN